MRSLDGGTTWAQYGDGYGLQYLIDPANADVLYSWDATVSRSYYVYGNGDLNKYSAGDTAAQVLTETLPGRGITAAAVSLQAPHTLLVATLPGLDVVVGRLNAQGTQADFISYIGGYADEYPLGIAVDGKGNTFVAGLTNSRNFPTAPDAFQRTLQASGTFVFSDPRINTTPASLPNLSREPNGFVAKVDSAGNQVYGTYLGGAGEDMLTGIGLLPDGSAVVTGLAESSNYPVTPKAVIGGGGVLSRLSPDGGALTYSSMFAPLGGSPNWLNGLIIGTAGAIYTVGHGILMVGSFPISSGPAIGTEGVVDVFTGTPGEAAPGTVLSIYGTNLSSDTATASPPLPAAVAGTSVFVNGLSAPLYFVSSSQINFQVPFETPAGRASVAVQSAYGSSLVGSITVSARAPVLFTDPSNQYLRAVKDDGTITSPSNPVQSGSSISVFLIGQGSVTNSPGDGFAALSDPLSQVDAPYSATVGSLPAVVSYLGLAPDFVGLAQANVVVPALPPGTYPFVLTIDGKASAPGEITVSAK